MKNFRKILLILAVVFSALLSFSVYYYMNERSVATKVVEQEYISIVVATESIPPRTKVTKEMLTTIEVADDGFYDAYILNTDEIIGYYTRESILAGEGIRSERIIQNINDELSLKIKDDYRAISITVNKNTGVSDLIKTGDWIDIVLTLPAMTADERTSRPDLSIMFLQNVNVLAVDRNLYRDEMNRIDSPDVYTLTLAVPVKDVEKLVLAENIGELKVALRPLDGDYVYNTGGTIWEELIIDDFDRIKDLFPQYEIIAQQEVTETPVEIQKYIYYTVKYGDTLNSISLAFYGDESRYSLIQTVNRIADEDLIVVGTALKIPVLENTEAGDDGGTEN
ncbi:MULTISPECIES: Flp pilus assembly protein CpaB [unclassified Fusibacter]|uniref:Flp pilus assembly protein CpaB n=1 Tax=unclassified Fusibacter TaxID=2624464 RepID=UPI0013E92A35|nr:MULTISPECIES: Flp pilus assembly protein CpaB [unclassified Fusibacter]MCK8059962.1 Flp pilus assembly protein CpaB [Fusibacter sp. A2]NPE22104.1 Flp pilus assembly protein CpaB [Fusibacter sp. A1]